MRCEVGIGPKSVCHEFLNKIVAHPLSDGGLGIIRLGCTKFGTSFIKFGTSDPTDFETPISAWMVHNFI